MSGSEQYDNQISSLYQQQSTELPSAQIDANIASMAKHHLAENSKIINLGFARKFSALKWQWPLSIAASVMLVSVIFVNNQSEFIPQSNLPESASQPPISAAAEDESQRLAIVPEPIDIQEQRNIQEQSDIQIQSDVQEQRNIQKQNDLQYAAAESKRKLQDKGQESEKRAISNARAPQIETQMAALKKQHQQLQKTVATEEADYHGGSEYFDSTQSEEIVVTGSRLSSDVESTAQAETEAEAEVQVRFKQQVNEDSKLSLSAFERLDTELLDSLVVDYEQLQAQSALAQEQERTDNLVARLNQTKSLTPQAREHAIQQAIFEYLLGFQQANPDTQLPDKYVSILSPQMKVELSRSLGQNHPSHTENTKKDQQ